MHCPSIVPELSPSSVYSRRFPSSDSSRKSSSFLVWSTVSDVGLPSFPASNPVGDPEESAHWTIAERTKEVTAGNAHALPRQPHAADVIDDQAQLLEAAPEEQVVVVQVVVALED